MYSGVGSGVGKPAVAVDGLWMRLDALGRAPLPPAELAEGSCGERNVSLSHLMDSAAEMTNGPRGFSEAISS